MDRSGFGALRVEARHVEVLEIPENSITGSKIQDGSITDEDISATASIGFSKLSGVAPATHDHDDSYVKVGEAGSVTTGMLQDGVVSTAKLSDNAVTGPKIQDGAITVGKLSDGSVTSAKILDGSILFSDLGSNGCGANQVMKWNGSAWMCGNDEVGAGGDNLGNHVATQNVRLNGNWLSGDGENEGIFVTSEGKVGIGTSSPNEQLEISGNLSLPLTTSSVGTIKMGGVHSFMPMGVIIFSPGWVLEIPR